MDSFTQLAVYSEENICIHIQHAVAPFWVLYRSVLGFFFFFNKDYGKKGMGTYSPRVRTATSGVSIPASGGNPGGTTYQECHGGVLVSHEDEAPRPV